MPIEATQPTTISATYPYWAFAFRTNGFPCAKPGSDVVATVSCTVVMKRFRVRDDGIPEESPLPSDIIEFTVTDLYASAAAKPRVAVALTAVLEAIAEEAADRGAL